jgi:hypothetical protein
MAASHSVGIGQVGDIIAKADIPPMISAGHSIDVARDCRFRKLPP